MSRATLKAIQAAAGNAGEAVYVDNLFSTDVWNGGNGVNQGYDSTALSLPDQTLAFTDSGNKTIGWDAPASTVRVRSLSTPWDLSTASVHSSTSSLSNNGGEYYMTQDGTRMYNNPGSGTVYQYSLSTAFDLSTASLVNSQSGFASGPGLVMKDDGTKLITSQPVSSVATAFQEWTLTTPYDITSASLQTTTAGFLDGGYTTTSISNDGHHFYFMGSRADILSHLYLPTAWSLTGVNPVGSVGAMPISGAVGIGVAIGGDNNELIWVGNNSNGWYKWETNFDVTYILKIIGYEKAATQLNLVDDDPEYLVWTKDRSLVAQHYLVDSVRGIDEALSSNLADAENTTATIGSVSISGWGRRGGVWDTTNSNFVSWTFRKQPGFCDIVTWDGDGTGAGRVISHNLGSVPGMMIVKSYVHPSGVGNTDWQVYHRQLNGGTNPEQYGILLNGAGAEGSYGFWNNTAPTSTQFTIGGGNDLNGSGGKYIAYLFAHDAQDFGTNSDESIIKCGSYTGNGSTTGPVIDLGFEPQWILQKKSGGVDDWHIFDTMRGIASGSNDYYLRPNGSDDENNNTWIDVTSTGFNITSSQGNVNSSGVEYIYVAIRRPHKPAEEFAATDLFALDQGGDGLVPAFNSGFPVDWGWENQNVTTTSNFGFFTRILGDTNRLVPANSGAEVGGNTGRGMDYMDGWVSASRTSNGYSWMWRRAPGFFDVVAYAGVGGGQTLNHNLGFVPEMIWVKNRTYVGGEPWTVGHHGLNGGSNPWEYWVQLNDINAEQDLTSSFADFQPTTTQFKVGNDRRVDFGGNNFVAYLFATVSGISKVGSYTGTGSDVNVNCGFTSGARFVLVKRADLGGGWYLWDSVRGIVAGNDPYLLLNSNSAQVTSTDYIDPLSSGFTITSTAPAALNASGGNYIFLAIA
jgi:hypothetical protein